MSHVLITGATGFVGSFVTEQLISQNHQVTCLIRASSNLKWIRHLPLTFCQGSLADPTGWISHLEGVEYVIHVAGVTKARNREEYYQGNVQATEHLLAALSAHCTGIKRFLLVSSQGAVGPSPDPHPIDESYSPQPLTDYGKSKLQSEVVARGYMDRLPVTIVRPPVVYGPRDRDVLNFFRTIKRGVNVMIGKVDQQVNLIYVKDLAAGIIQAAFSPATAGKTYFLCEKRSYLWSQVVKITSEIMGKKIRSIRLPFPLVSGIAFILEGWAGLSGTTTILNRQKMAEIKQPYWIISPAQAERDFSFTTRFPLPLGIGETVEWYEDQKWL